MPPLMTTAPGLTMSGVTMSGLPTAAMTTSALRVWRSISVAATALWSDGDRRIAAGLLEGQQQRERATQGRSAPDDHDLAPGDVDAVVLQHRADAGRCGGERSRLLEHQPAEALGMQAVRILVRDPCAAWPG